VVKNDCCHNGNDKLPSLCEQGAAHDTGCSGIPGEIHDHEHRESKSHARILPIRRSEGGIPTAIGVDTLLTFLAAYCGTGAIEKGAWNVTEKQEQNVDCARCRTRIKINDVCFHQDRPLCADCAVEIRMKRSRKTHWQYIKSVKSDYLSPARRPDSKKGLGEGDGESRGED